MISICFTGHRPNNKYMGGYNVLSLRNQLIAKNIRETIEKRIIYNPIYLHEPINFITGGAIGIDQMAFEVCNSFKTNTSLGRSGKIYLEVAVPFKNQFCKWNNNDIKKYFNQLKIADKVTNVDTIKEYARSNGVVGEYNGYKMQLRNEYMVDNSSIVIAVWDHKSIKNSGTHNCIKYAKSKGKDVIYINIKELNKI